MTDPDPAKAAHDAVDWALDRLATHPVTKYVGETRAFGLALQLAELRIDLEVKLIAAFPPPTVYALEDAAPRLICTCLSSGCRIHDGPYQLIPTPPENTRDA